MKLTHKLCGAALLSLVGVALAVPNTTKAVDSVKDGSGHIKFTLTDPGTDITDPGSGTTITNIPSVTDPGTFGIMAVTPLEFETHSVLTAQTKRDYDASPFLANPGSVEPGNEEFEVQNFVKYRDIRTTVNHTYKLSAALTQNFKDVASGTYLTGSELTFANIDTTSLDAVAQPKGVTPTNKLTANADNTLPGASAEFIRNEVTDNTGAGNIELNFGRHTLGTAGNSVKLTIPTSTSIGIGDYNAVITWTLSETL
ncbi:WxL domain-containing protein [Enterococcus crotali]|uniref:WxL domain-containing protein n=1 Tax=Enterococcus crotali TaxID=1453587 RepID=UPI000470F94A|nr:WxL domain-containing protein [Enterococcus crotali]